VTKQPHHLHTCCPVCEAEKLLAANTGEDCCFPCFPSFAGGGVSCFRQIFDCSRVRKNMPNLSQTKNPLGKYRRCLPIPWNDVTHSRWVRCSFWCKPSLSWLKFAVCCGMTNHPRVFIYYSFRKIHYIEYRPKPLPRGKLVLYYENDLGPNQHVER